MTERPHRTDVTFPATLSEQYTMARDYREEAELDKDWERQYKTRQIHRSNHQAKHESRSTGKNQRRTSHMRKP
ncbi:MAG: hypothetical protein AB7P17_00105 [Nitrospirales bacterium]|nr:hypothetical protein [Nitrospirales bacterium]